MTTTDLVLPAQLTAPPRLTQRHPWLHPVAVRAYRMRRRWAWLTSDARWAVRRPDTPAPYRIKQHGSLLMRQLGASEMWLQQNKVTNLRLASACVDGVAIRPGETFSFNRVVGNCTRRRGFVPGMRLSNGAARPGIGGGLCQLANLLAWMFMHSDLTIVERSEHSFDPFPDNGRVLPWGVGCSIAYNYVDLVVRNDTDATFTLSVAVGERYLEGELRSDREPARSFSVHARNEEFLRHEGRVFRRNQIWRDVIDRRTGNRVDEELMMENCALVVYEPTGVEVIDV
ncbi:VanW family protein [Nocardioides terrisoli]|uniref:VanW family protein n=1 Tax=Nocardioides terrisoli TaxID=3388267 RepID=UPI00287BA4CA|nr:VanW family protein [Nocardioides marmorisolisilvae]